METIKPKYIIAIGASAGGLEEINIFFDNTPLDGVAYVIVQHLSADFKSRMAELLAKHSQLHIKEAANGDKLKKNEVYLIPNDKFMTIKDGTLHLSDKGNKGPHLTINTFFTSLAQDYGIKAIGVILSGLGSDGTAGVMEIKKKGGMVMARTPETSAFSSMPAHAIATGMVDYILEPELMPAAIEDYVERAEKLLTASSEDDVLILEIIKLIEQTSPHDFSGYKQTTILRRTKKRAAQENFETLTSYFEHLKKNPEEVIALGKEFLISVTSFFRDGEAFDYIQEKIIPDLLQKLTPQEELKVWVAGCATGEEAYSLAILIAEQLGEHYNTVVKIFATDIDVAALAHAANGVYSSDINKAVKPERLEKYFNLEGENYKVKQSIRKMIIFAQHDLVKNPPYCNMHLVSCRNLLIYMAPPLQKKVFNMLLFGLKMNGYLFLGASENPSVIMNSLEISNKRWKIYRNTKPKKIVSFDAFSMPTFPHTTPKSVLLGHEYSKSNNNQLTELMCNALVREVGYLCVFVDEHHQVVKSYGDTSKFMQQENFNTNLEELLKPPLALAFSTLCTTALKKSARASVSGVKIYHDEDLLNINLAVEPLQVKSGNQKILMVLFNEQRHHEAKIVSPVFDEQIYHNEYTQNLKQELKELKVKLNEIADELDSSNENMQSFSEELISANEEMQSTNEEMQSVNEELHTINTDYQLKNKELLEINDDLNNYFRSNVNGQLFINKELLLMKFSPGAVNLINLMDTDIGRPIHHISTNIKFENLIEDIENVLFNDTMISKEIETTNGKWYQMMIMPYLQQSIQKSSGAIITFSDISELKAIQFELNQKNQSLLRINADLDHFIHAASHDLLAPLGNIETSIDVMNRIALTDEKMTDILNLINRSIKTYRLLITDIAKIAKIESDMTVMEMVNLDDVLDNIEWSLSDKIIQSGAKITRALEVNAIPFSKKNLRSILFNMVANAIKFRSAATPQINVKCLRQGKEIVLIVKDNGKGIDLKGQEKIFAMYGRLNQDIEGSGIGLYLAKKIVNAAGGKIILESEMGKGTTFTIYLHADLTE